MGYMRHHAICVTSWDADELARARSAALNRGLLVSAIIAGAINGEDSFFCAPDGSKEFWPESEKFDEARESFAVWLRGRCDEDGASSLAWCEVQYGDDDGDDRLLRSSHLDRRQDLKETS